MFCPECNIELDHLDTITKRVGIRETIPLYDLFVCHNEDCRFYGSIWNDSKYELEEGDPSGNY